MVYDVGFMVCGVWLVRGLRFGVWCLVVGGWWLVLRA